MIRSEERETIGTKRGRELVRALMPDYMDDGAYDQACAAASTLCRHAATHARLMEAACSEPWAEGAAFDARVTDVERRIADLATTLGRMLGVKTVASFQGDPRGYTVRLTCLPGRGNTWHGPSLYGVA